MALAPRCPKCTKALSSEINLERAYVRRSFNSTREWIPIGWYCDRCGLLQPDNHELPMAVDLVLEQ